jgi:hypothetical protein
MDYSKAFNTPEKKRNWFLVIATLFNCAWYWLLTDVTIFLLRQVFIFFWYTILTVFSDEVQYIINERNLITATLKEKFPLLKLETFFFVSFCVSFWCIFSPTFGKSPFVNIPLLVAVFYAILIFYRFYCIYQTPEVWIKYNVIEAIRMHGIISLNCFKALLYCLSETMKFVLAFFVFFCWSPKLFYGIDYRTAFANVISRSVTGIQSDSEEIYAKGSTLIDEFPKCKELITQSDGFTLNKEEVQKVFNYVYGNFPF